MACVEIERCVLPCNPSEDFRLGPKEKPSGLLPSSWHTLLWSRGMCLVLQSTQILTKPSDCLWCGFMWTVDPISRHSHKDLYSSGWLGLFQFLDILPLSQGTFLLPFFRECLLQAGGMAASCSSLEAVLSKPGGGEAPGGGRPRGEDGLQAQRNPASPEPEERICEDGYGGRVHLGSLLRLWRD